MRPHGGGEPWWLAEDKLMFVYLLRGRFHRAWGRHIEIYVVSAQDIAQAQRLFLARFGWPISLTVKRLA